MIWDKVPKWSWRFIGVGMAWGAGLLTGWRFWSSPLMGVLAGMMFIGALLYAVWPLILRTAEKPE